MKPFIHQDTLNKIQYQLSKKSIAFYQSGKARYKTFSKRQRGLLLSGIGFLILLVVILSMSHLFHRATSKVHYPIHFDSPIPIKHQNDKQTTSVRLNKPLQNNNTLLHTALKALSTSTHVQLQHLQAQIQSLQAQIGSLASQHDIQQLQHTVTLPNKTLLGTMNSLQSTLQTMVKRTIKSTWLDPQTVNAYFRLVAIQGFSDGMRAIIDVNGHQTALSINEPCPACRGWTLNSMDFTHQSAVFTKLSHKHTFYVRLQAN